MNSSFKAIKMPVGELIVSHGLVSSEILEHILLMRPHLLKSIVQSVIVLLANNN